MTPEWKQDVIDKLERNKLEKKQPRTLAGLAASIDGADKRGIYETFKPGQLTSVYVDAICDVLGIAPPQIAAPGNVESDETKLRLLSVEKQAALLTFVNGLSDAIRNLPTDQQQPLRALIAKFLRDFFADS